MHVEVETIFFSTFLIFSRIHVSFNWSSQNKDHSDTFDVSNVRDSSLTFLVRQVGNRAHITRVSLSLRV